MTLPTLRLLTALVLLAGPLAAAPSFSPLFTDHAVLPAGPAVPIWGRAEPGEQITLTLGDRSVRAVADASGRWRADLGPLEASATPRELIAAGRDGARAVSTDVLVGELWLASGQSNMAMRLSECDPAARQAATTPLPAVREFLVKRVAAAEPAAEPEGRWVVAAPASAARKFSAVAHLFARELHTSLNRPIGVVVAAWSSTFVESWIPPAALAADPAFSDFLPAWERKTADYPARLAAYESKLAAWEAARAAAKASGEGFTRSKPHAPDHPVSRGRPGSIFDGMIAPLSTTAFRGVIWYQGENNAVRASAYAPLFRALITSWRERFAKPDLPFIWVQLPSFAHDKKRDGTVWPRLREAQAASLSLPYTGQAVTIDLGDPADIHPKDKLLVARRLASLVLARVYGNKIVADSPTIISSRVEGASVLLKVASTGGLLVPDGATPAGFELAGADRQFYPAHAIIEEDGLQIRLTSPSVPSPVAARYAWRNVPTVNLRNAADLPLAPFRSDDWTD